MYRNVIAAAAAASFFTYLVPTASAHVSLQQDQAAPGPFKAVLGVPHGCDGQPTTAVRVQLPEGFVGAKPMPKAGWTIDIEQGDYARTYTLHGREVGSGPVAVTWKGGPLDDGHYDEFALRGTLAGVEEGQRLFFKTVQTCAEGTAEWVEEPAQGQDSHSLERPAPVLTILAAETAGHQHEAAVSAGALEIAAPWARAMLPGQPTGGAYLDIVNTGESADRLVSVRSPRAGKVEIHTMKVVNEVMTMRPVEGGLEIPAGERVELKPGGLHLMFMDVEERFEEGQTVPVILEFEKAGAVEMDLPVKPASAGRGEAHQH